MSLASWILRRSGWSPIGRLVEIHIEDSGFRPLLGKQLLARVVELRENGSAILELNELIQEGAQQIRVVLAYPRHRGYDFFHMGLGAIAVDLSPSAAEQRGDEEDTRFATGVVKVCRKSAG